MARKRPSRHFYTRVMQVMAGQIMQIITIVFHCFAFLGALTGSLFPSYDVLSSIVSSFAEIIAGLYGITMASYTFFLSRIDSLAAANPTLDAVTDSIKLRFKRLIWAITFHVTMTLFTTMLLMYLMPPEAALWLFFYRLFCNEFILSVISSILLILGYSILVIDPNCLEKEARKLKKNLSPREEPAGSAVEFLSLYRRIEGCCQEMLPEAVRQTHLGSNFQITLPLLLELHPDLEPLYPTLQRVYQYYACTINAGTLAVSEEMCTIARWVLEQLNAPAEIQ